MTDEVNEAETEEERKVRLAAEAHKALLADIDAEAERGRWFIYRAGTQDEAILTAEEFRVDVDRMQMQGKAEDYRAVDPETLMMESMAMITAGQRRVKTILAKLVPAEITEQGETERV